MLAVLLRRLVAVPLVLLALSVFVFALPTLTGTDVARATLRARIAESEPDPKVLQAIREELALDRPLLVQYASFTKQLLKGDFGYGYASRKPVRPAVMKALGISGLLGGLAMALAVIMAVPLGLFAAARQGGWFDRALNLLTRTVISVPMHVLAPLLILVLAVQLRWLPTGGWATPRHMVLPVIATSLVPMGLLAQLVRSETVDALKQSFIRTARAKGLPPWRVLWHAGRVSLTGTMAIGSTFLASLMGGSVVTEVIFTIPGMGNLLYDAVTNLDLPMLQGGLFVTLVAGLGVGLLSDVLAVLIDPRIRYR
ncbi:MAG: ABC transporter permease [Brachymonas sp.]|nr:ABC transporter permease [Brachymonas sp.]